MSLFLCPLFASPNCIPIPQLAIGSCEELQIRVREPECSGICVETAKKEEKSKIEPLGVGHDLGGEPSVCFASIHSLRPFASNFFVDANVVVQRGPITTFWSFSTIFPFDLSFSICFTLVLLSLISSGQSGAGPWKAAQRFFANCSPRRALFFPRLVSLH